VVNRVMEVPLHSHLGWILLFGLPHRAMAHVFLSWVLILNIVRLCTLSCIGIMVSLMISFYKLLDIFKE